MRDWDGRPTIFSAPPRAFSSGSAGSTLLVATGLNSCAGAPQRAWADLSGAALVAVDCRIAAEIFLRCYEDIASRGVLSFCWRELTFMGNRRA